MSGCRPFVIPAQAGIQWFRQAIPARAGMTYAGYDFEACSRQTQAGFHLAFWPRFLDSGLRRAAAGVLPSRRIQDFLSINDGGGGNAN